MSTTEVIIILVLAGPATLIALTSLSGIAMALIEAIRRIKWPF